MILLLDENCRNLSDPLKKKGYKVEIAPEIISLLEGNKSVTDDQIVEYAKDHKTIIITYDKNLKLKAEKQGIPHFDPSSPEYQANRLDQEIKKMASWKDYL